jgi:hypothetical protein
MSGFEGGPVSGAALGNLGILNPISHGHVANRGALERAA